MADALPDQGVSPDQWTADEWRVHIERLRAVADEIRSRPIDKDAAVTVTLLDLIVEQRALRAENEALKASVVKATRRVLLDTGPAVFDRIIRERADGRAVDELADRIGWLVTRLASDENGQADG